MSDVVLRCPHCGTTQPAAGECESCHEAQVRYYCRNHAPGRWLDGPTCAECGARAERERAARDADARDADARDADARLAAARERAARERAGRAAAAREGAAREAARRAPAPPEPPPVSLEDLLRAHVERTSGRSRRVGAPHVRVPGVPLLGCLGRLLALGVVLVVVLLLGTCWFLGGTAGVQGWVVELGQQTGVVGGLPAQTQRGIDAFRAGDRETAARELAEAARLYPRSAVALIYLARIRLDEGDDERAREHLREAVARDPASAVAHRELAGVYLARARRARGQGADPLDVGAELESADRFYARALQLDPADRTARGYHACALAALGRDAEAAEARAAAGAGPWDGCARALAP